jgi:hypothetical protein
MKRLPGKKEDLQSREERKIKTKDETRTRKHAGRSEIIVRRNSQMKKKKKKKKKQVQK